MTKASRPPRWRRAGGDTGSGRTATGTRRGFLLAAASALLVGGPALAQQDAATRSVVRQLEAQGFDVVSVRTTLLGRVQVLSRRGDLQREIVFDPRNGSILRDFTVDEGGDPSIGPEPGGATSHEDATRSDGEDIDGDPATAGGGGDADDDDDEDEDDDRGGDRGGDEDEGDDGDDDDGGSDGGDDDDGDDDDGGDDEDDD